MMAVKRESKFAASVGLVTSLLLHALLFWGAYHFLSFPKEKALFQSFNIEEVFEEETPLLVDTVFEISEVTPSHEVEIVEMDATFELTEDYDIPFISEGSKALTYLPNVNSAAAIGSPSIDLKQHNRQPGTQAHASKSTTAPRVTQNRPATNSTLSAQELKKPRFKKCPKPEYPRIARRHKYEGRVLIKVLISIRGEVSAAEIVQSSGHPILDNEAYQTILGWKFFPGTIDGTPTPMRSIIPISFSLDT